MTQNLNVDHSIADGSQPTSITRLVVIWFIIWPDVCWDVLYPSFEIYNPLSAYLLALFGYNCGDSWSKISRVGNEHAFFFAVFKELLARPEHDQEPDHEEELDRKNGAPHIPKIGDIKKASRYSIPDLAVDVEQVMGLEKASKKVKANTVGGKNKLKKIFDKTLTSILPPKPYK